MLQCPATTQLFQKRLKLKAEISEFESTGRVLSIYMGEEKGEVPGHMEQTAENWGH